MPSLSKIISETVLKCLTEDINLEFPDFLKRLRTRLGFSGKSFSELIGIKNTDYNDFENKNYFKCPNDKQLAKIAEAYEISFELLKDKRDEYVGAR